MEQKFYKGRFKNITPKRYNKISFRTNDIEFNIYTKRSFLEQHERKIYFFCFLIFFIIGNCS